MTRIELIDLTKTYPRQERPAVAGVSLGVASHTLLALLGPSGSGKSSVLKLIAGVEAPDAGDIRLDGASLRGAPAHRRGALPATRRDQSFRGDHIEYLIDLSGTPLRARVPASDAQRLTGQVFVQFPPGQLFVVRDDAADGAAWGSQ